MPTFSFGYGDNRLSKIRAAWKAHYMRKGCSERKACALSLKKWRTLPPAS